jgi:hypothetical protein
MSPSQRQRVVEADVPVLHRWNKPVCGRISFVRREQKMQGFVHRAASPGDIEPPSPVKRQWRDILLGTYRSISEDRVLAVAAGVAFYALLSVFPAIGAVVGFMIWMWLSAAVIIVGAELNAEIEKAAGEPHAQGSGTFERDVRVA